MSNKHIKTCDNFKFYILQVGGLQKKVDEMENTQRDIVTEYEEHVMHLKEEVTAASVQARLLRLFKDGAYFCYCAYVMRISRYSGFLWVVPTK